MPRITSGELKGRIITYPASERFRPTMDKVKEAIFSMLGQEMVDARVLDLYAAAGGLGLEALSRGARQAVFVEQNTQALRALEANIRSLGLEDRAIVARQDVRVYLRQSKFFATHVFCDPPYRSSLVEETLRLLAVNPGVLPETLIVLEHATAHEVDIPTPLELVRRKDYGETALSFIRKSERRAR